jgi:signal peptidase II
MTLFSGVILLDRITKLWALSSPLTQATLVLNRGVSWGMMHSDNPYMFYMVTALALFITGIVYRDMRKKFLSYTTAYGHILVCAGSYSNICDRFIYGGVIDFISFTTPLGVWPSFNIADVAIVIGACIMFKQVLSHES